MKFDPNAANCSGYNNNIVVAGDRHKVIPVITETDKSAGNHLFPRTLYSLCTLLCDAGVADILVVGKRSTEITIVLYFWVVYISKRSFA